MKLKDLVSVVKNKNNNQTNLNIRKRKLKELDISELDLLNSKINLNKFFK